MNEKNMKPMNSNWLDVSSIKSHKYYKLGVFGISLVVVVIAIGYGSRLLAKSIRGINELKSAMNGN